MWWMDTFTYKYSVQKYDDGRWRLVRIVVDTRKYDAGGGMVGGRIVVVVVVVADGNNIELFVRCIVFKDSCSDYKMRRYGINETIREL